MRYWQGVVAGGGAALLGLIACGGTVDLRQDGAGASAGTSAGSSAAGTGTISGSGGKTTGDDQPPEGGASPVEPVPGAGGEGGSSPLPSCLGELNCPWSLLGGADHSRGQAIVPFEDSFYWFGGESWERDREPFGDDDPIDLPDLQKATLNTVVQRYDPATGDWVERAPLPRGAYVLTAHALGNKIYVFGSYGIGGFDPGVQIYDPGQDSWSEGPAAPTERYIVSSQVVDGKVYVIGGHGPNADDASEWDYKTEVDIFDPTGGWSSGTPLPQPTVAGAASCAFDGRIYIFGGEVSNHTSIYDVAQGAWSLGAAPPVARNGHACVEVDGALLLFGGRNSDALDLVERYDPTTDTWSSGFAPMPVPSYWFGAGALDSKVYLFGGAGASDFAGLLNHIQVFDLDAPPWHGVDD